MAGLALLTKAYLLRTRPLLIDQTDHLLADLVAARKLLVDVEADLIDAGLLDVDSVAIAPANSSNSTSIGACSAALVPTVCKLLISPTGLALLLLTDFVENGGLAGVVQAKNDDFCLVLFVQTHFSEAYHFSFISSSINQIT